MDKIAELFRAQKIKVTPQRLCLYSHLLDSKTHLSADELNAHIKSELPAISLGTVYANLDLLKRKGLVEEIKIDFGKSYYEARNQPHHHFLCRKCQRIYDVDVPVCPSLKDHEVEGHKIEDFQGYFYGQCRQCYKRKTQVE
jgi:Fur family transcriptional regulator, peroxide stress response regulator